MLLQYIVLHAYYRGDDIVFGEKEYSKPPSPVKAVLEGRQLGWGLMGPRGMFGHFLIFQGCGIFSLILACRHLCTSQFQIIISSSRSPQMLTCKFFDFRKFQSDISKCCRVLQHEEGSHLNGEARQTNEVAIFCPAYRL